MPGKKGILHKGKEGMKGIQGIRIDLINVRTDKVAVRKVRRED